MEKNYVVMDIDRYENQICRFYEHIKSLEQDANHYRDLYHNLRDAVIETIEYISSETEGDIHYAVIDTNKFLARLEAAADYRPIRDMPNPKAFDEPEAVTEENEESNE